MMDYKAGLDVGCKYSFFFLIVPFIYPFMTTAPKHLCMCLQRTHFPPWFFFFSLEIRTNKEYIWKNKTIFDCYDLSNNVFKTSFNFFAFFLLWTLDENISHASVFCASSLNLNAERIFLFLYNKKCQVWWIYFWN